MSEAADHQTSEDAPTAGHESPTTAEAPTATETSATGDALVDEVLADLETLDRRPVSEHVAAFESAHERLRSALTDAGDETVPAGSTPDRDA